MATKIIWNNVLRPITSDDYDLRFFDCQSQYTRPGQDQNVILDLEVGHYAGYDLFGRTEVEPMPVDPDFKQSGRLWLFGLYPFLSPEAQRGQGLIRYRYAGSEPRRRRLGLESRHPPRAAPERVAEQHRDGSADLRPRPLSRASTPRPKQYSYKFLGEQEMLASGSCASIRPK